MSCVVFFPPPQQFNLSVLISLNCPSSVIGPCDTYVLQPATHSVAPVEGLQLPATLEQTLQSSSNQLAKGPAEGFPVPLQPCPLVEFVPVFMRRV